MTELEEKLQLRKALVDITNRIHAAQNIKQILVDLKDGILNLFNAHSITIYVVDRSRNEIYSMFLIGTQVKEIRVPINNRSIAGYVANTGKVVNIADAYDVAELKSIDKELTFDLSWDKKSGFRTKQILAAPIFHNKTLMGVVQILNKKRGPVNSPRMKGVFSRKSRTSSAVAFFNQERYARRRKTRFDYLISHDLLKEEDLDNAWEESREAKETIEDFLMKKYKISREDLGRSFEEFFRCKFIPFSDKYRIPGDLLINLKKEYLRRELWVPLEKKDGVIHIIVDDPNNILKRDMIENLLKTKSVRYDVSLSGRYHQIHQPFLSVSRRRVFHHRYPRQTRRRGGDPGGGGDVVTESDSVIMQLVNKIILDAQAKRASDIHIEPNVGKEECRGPLPGRRRLRPLSDPPLQLPCGGRLPHQDHVESRHHGPASSPGRQDQVQETGRRGDRTPRGHHPDPGRGGGCRDADPGQGGETLPLDSMGMSVRNFKELRAILDKPYGMILVVGPTGSGKTTTLHAALHEINKPDRKIWTAEDPVEITQYGLRQVQVQSKIGFDFAAAMRAFLRADPDVIMVGEMRDFETAKTGVEASLTGHLVFSTLHTNSAPETIVRLLDMGIDPLNFADALLGILAQRLVRTLCKKCKEAYHPDRKEFDEIVQSYGEEQFLKLNIPYDDKFTLYRPKGCDVCDKTGYKGRMGIHELIVATDGIKRLIQKHETVEAMRDLAMEEGMTTLLQDGIFKSIQGVTDFKQVRRVCIK